MSHCRRINGEIQQETAKAHSKGPPWRATASLALGRRSHSAPVLLLKQTRPGRKHQRCVIFCHIGPLAEGNFRKKFSSRLMLLFVTGNYLVHDPVPHPMGLEFSPDWNAA